MADVLSEVHRSRISRGLIGNTNRRGKPHDEATKARIAASVSASYVDGRHQLYIPPGGGDRFRAFNAKIRSGAIKAPWRKLDDDGAVVALYAELHSLRLVAAHFGVSKPAIRRAIRRHHARSV